MKERLFHVKQMGINGQWFKASIDSPLQNVCRAWKLNSKHVMDSFAKGQAFRFKRNGIKHIICPAEEKK